MRPPRTTLRLLLTLLLLAGAGSGLFAVRHVLAQDDPVDLDPAGYCCIDSYAAANGGVCLGSIRNANGSLVDDADNMVTEQDCQDGPASYYYEPGKLWNGDKALCRDYCGERLGYWYCDPRANTEGGEGGADPYPAYTCIQNVVHPQQGDDPSIIGFGYTTQEACGAVCTPPANVTVEVKCHQACTTNEEYTCEITVTNTDPDNAAKVTEVFADAGWNVLDPGDAPSVQYDVQEATLYTPGQADEDWSDEWDTLDPDGKLHFPKRDSLNALPGEQTHEPIVLEPQGSFHAQISLAGQSTAITQNTAITQYSGWLSAWAVVPGDPNGDNNQTYDNLRTGTNCSLDGEFACVEEGAITGEEYEEPVPTISYTVTVPEGPENPDAPVEVTIPLPVNDDDEYCVVAEELTFDAGYGVQGGLLDAMFDPIDPDGDDTAGCWFNADDGTVECLIVPWEDSPRYPWFSVSIDPDAGCDSVETSATITLPGQEPYETDAVTTQISSCGACSMCGECMAQSADTGSPVSCSDPSAGAADAKAACEGDGNPCRWIEPDSYVKDGQTVYVGGRCAPDPNAFDDQNDDGNWDSTEPYLCDYTYGCCTYLPDTNAGVNPGDEDPEQDNGYWYYLFGSVAEGVQTQEFEAAKECVETADEDYSNAWHVASWESVEDPEDAKVVGEREACEEDSGSSSSASSTSERPETEGYENLYCDRRLLRESLTGGGTSQQETSGESCWIRDPSSTVQSPYFGTVMFNPPFYSEDPYDSEGAVPVGYYVGDDDSDTECEGFCAKAKNVGVCCRPYKQGEESCPVMASEDCAFILVNFEQQHSDECFDWESVCWDQDNAIVDCDTPGATSTCAVFDEGGQGDGGAADDFNPGLFGEP